MSKEIKSESAAEIPDEKSEGQEQSSRRDFLRRLGKWSAVLIGAAAGGRLLDVQQSAAWVNGGGAWVNARGGGGGSWVNRAGGGGGAWVNRAGGGGGSWVNRAGGGGGA